MLCALNIHHAGWSAVSNSIHFIHIQDGKSGLILASELGHELVMFNLLDYGAELDFKHEVPTLLVSRTSQFNNYSVLTCRLRAGLLCSLLLRIGKM